MANDAKVGPLSVADLLAVWVAAVDDTYAAPFLAAGEGNGLEAYTQGFAQMERVSRAIDVSTQAYYILPWSGQTNPPAAGEQKATVELTFTRSQLVNQPLRLTAGAIFFDEQTNDWGEQGSVPVLTGRRYTLLSDVIFLPGDIGPIAAQAVAEKPGYGYNNPLPGTIQVFDQTGSRFYNDLATVKIVTGTTPPGLPPPALIQTLISANKADTFVPEHVGQYVRFTAGANVGIIARIIAFAPPTPNATPPAGSAVQLEAFLTIESHAGIAGTFQIGEPISIKNGASVVGTSVLSAISAGAAGAQKIGFVLTTGAVVTGNTLLGETSAATASVDVILASSVLTAEAPSLGSGGASWIILDWAMDLGGVVSNVAQPLGGLIGMLDGIGYDRNIGRAPGESDSSYRKRVHQIADVVTPNAIRRALNRALGAIPWCFREVGSALLPGFFYDRTNDPNGDFYDYDVLIFTGTMAGAVPFIDPQSSTGYQERVEYRDAHGNALATGYFGSLAGGTVLTLIRKGGVGTTEHPVNVSAGDVVVGLSSGAIFDISSNTPNAALPMFEFHYILDYTDFRAFFLVGVPRVGYGECGFAWAGLPATDASNDANSFYDTPALHNFFDGFPTGAPAFYGRVSQAVDSVRAGGVGFTLYLTDGPCS